MFYTNETPHYRVVYGPVCLSVQHLWLSFLSLNIVCSKNQATNFTQAYVIRNINVLLQTFFDDSALFYASGEPYLHHYVAVSLLNGTVHVEVDFGVGVVSTTIGQGLLSNHWNNFTIAHRHSRIIVHLNDESKELQLPGPNYYLYIDPEIYIGGGPELHRKKGSTLAWFTSWTQFCYTLMHLHITFFHINTPKTGQNRI